MASLRWYDDSGKTNNDEKMIWRWWKVAHHKIPSYYRWRDFVKWEFVNDGHDNVKEKQQQNDKKQKKQTDKQT